MEGPNGADGTVRGNTVAAQYVNAHTGRMSAFNPGLFGVDFTPPSHPLPGKVGRDPAAGLCGHAGASINSIVREVDETVVPAKPEGS